MKTGMIDQMKTSVVKFQLPKRLINSPIEMVLKSERYMIYNVIGGIMNPEITPIQNLFKFIVSIFICENSF